MATAQPLPTPPITFSSGIRASSMKSSLNSASPVIWCSGPHLHRLLLHVHQEVGEPLVLGGVRVGARHEHAPLGLVGQRGPHLLAGDHPLAVGLHRLRLERRQVRARTPARRSPGTRSPRRRGSARGSAASALRCRGRSPPGRPSPARARWRWTGALARAISSPKMACSISVAPRAAVLLRPRQPRVARRVQLALPLLAEVEPGVVAGGLLARVVLVQPAPQLVAEGLLVGRERQVHEARMLTRLAE